jgi:hypothetical protein
MWLGDDNTMQGFGGPEGTDGQLYQWVEGVDGLGNAVGCWRRVQGQPAQAPYTRSAAPFLGEIAEGPDGNMYQWVQGVDGLGSAFGFWKRLKKLAKKAMPLARMAASFVPGGTAALTVASPFLRKVGVAGADGLGALYAAPDGSMYQVQGVDAGDDLDGLGAEELQGLEAGDELNGFDADDELNGFAAGDELNGFAAGDDLNGFEADAELNGFAADDGFGAEEMLQGMSADEVNGFAAGDEMNGIGSEDAMNGYVRDRGVSGVDAFVPDRPRETPAFSPSPNAPMWAPLW